MRPRPVSRNNKLLWGLRCPKQQKQLLDLLTLIDDLLELIHKACNIQPIRRTLRSPRA